MKIGILTQPLHTNYGGILQAYALQTVLERMGHEVQVLDREQKMHVNKYRFPLSVAKRVVKKYILGRKIRIFQEHYFNRTYPIISQYTQPFIDKYIHYRNVDDLSTLRPNEYEALVVGSDQIWRPSYYSKIENAFFAFAKDWTHVKRIAYAPSFGTNKWEFNDLQTQECKELIKMFNLVTVREDDGVGLCHSYLGVKATHVLDPTMLLDAADYEALVRQAGKVEAHPHILLSYVLDSSEHASSVIRQLAEARGLTPFYVSSKVEDVFAPLSDRIQKPVEEWLNGFMQADIVITDSFHACVFSILFNKPFVVLGNKKRGMSRFTSLLKLFGLEDRLVSSMDEIAQLGEIDWAQVNAKRQALKKKCLQMLEEGLRK